MAFDAHANFAISTVATAPVTPTAGTSLVLTTGDGAKFPAAPFNVVIWPTGVSPLTANAEIARCTAKASDTLTITRAQEGTSARTVVVGDQIMAAISAKTLTDVESAVQRLLSQDPQSGDYTTPQFYSGGDGSVAATLNEVRYALIYLPAKTYNGLAVRVGSAAGTAGAVLRLGLFQPDASRGLPGTLIVDAGTVASTSANAYQTLALGSSLVWPGGLAWVAVCAQVAASSYVAFSGAPMLGALVVNSDQTIYGNQGNIYKTTGLSGAYASNPALTYAGSGTGNASAWAPQIGVKAA